MIKKVRLYLQLPKNPVVGYKIIKSFFGGPGGGFLEKSPLAAGGIN